MMLSNSQLTILKTELSKFMYSSLLSSGSIGQVVTKLNAVEQTKRKPISFRSLLKWSANSGFLIKLKDISEDKTKKNTLRSAAYASLMMIQSPHTESLDISESSVSAMINVLVTEGELTSVQVTELQDLATQPCTNAEKLFDVDSVVVTKEDIRKAIAL